MSNKIATVKVNTQANTSGIDKATSSLKAMDSKFKGVLGGLKQFKGALGGLAVVQIGKSILDFADKAEDAYKTEWLAQKDINDALYSNMKARGATQKEIDGQVDSYKNLADTLQQIGVIGNEVTLGGMGIMTRMGLNPEDIKELTPLVQDLSIKYYGLNVSSEQYKETSQAVANMINTGRLSLQSYGVQITDVERKQFKAMNQEQRRIFVTNKLKNAVAGTNKEMAKTASGKIIQMNNMLGDSMEKIGQAVTQIKSNLATALLPTVQKVNGAFQEFMDVLNGVEPPEGGYKFINADEANNLQLIHNNLVAIGTDLSNIFHVDYGSLSELLGIEQFIADVQSACNEVKWLTGLLSGLRTAWDNAQARMQRLAETGQVEPPAENSDGAANGTNYWKGGRLLVGEYGPELVDLPRGASVNTNAQTQRELSGGGYTINCPVTVQGNVIGNEDFVNQIGSALTGRLQLALSNC